MLGLKNIYEFLTHKYNTQYVRPELLQNQLIYKLSMFEVSTAAFTFIGSIVIESISSI